MECENCKKNLSIKETDRYISILCKCEIILLYSSKTISRINKKNYKKQYKKWQS